MARKTKVKFLTSMAGTNEAGENFAHSVGDVVELDAKEAKRYVAAGICEKSKDDLTRRAPVMSTTGETAVELAQKERAAKLAGETEETGDEETGDDDAGETDETGDAETGDEDAGETDETDGEETDDQEDLDLDADAEVAGE